MNPLFLIAAAAGVIYLVTKKDEPKTLTPTGPGGYVIPPVIANVPGFAALPTEVQQQVIWIANNGTRAQILSFADAIEKANPGNKPLADALRAIASGKA